MEVYVAKDGQQRGPLTIEQVNSEAAAGRISPTDLAWVQGWDKWQTIAALPGFIGHPSVLPPGAPPPPTTTSSPPPSASSLSPPPPPPPGQTPVQGGYDQDVFLRTFVGNNYDYYSSKWAEAEQKPNKNTWNWAAFFLSLWWTAYRKMYLYAGLLLGIVVVETICEAFFQVPNNLFGAINLGIFLVYGFQGNRWYKLHAEQKIKQVTASGGSGEQIHARLAREGGTSAGAVVAFTVAAILLVFAVNLVPAIGQARRVAAESPKPEASSPRERTSPTTAKGDNEAAAREDWTIPPTVPGGWTTLSSQKQDLEMRRLAKSQEGRDLAVANKIIRIRNLPLNFYDDVDLCEAEVRQHNLQGVRVYLRQGSRTIPLDGSSDAIHRFNATNSPKLENASEASSYLRFFGSSIQGEEGIFRIIDTIDDVHWNQPTNSMERSDLVAKRNDLEDKIVPLRVSHSSNGAWTGIGTVAYSNAVFKATLTVDPAGNVEMKDDEPIASDLPVQIETFVDGVRVIHHQ